jgi:hypothetical protein
MMRGGARPWQPPPPGDAARPALFSDIYQSGHDELSSSLSVSVSLLSRSCVECTRQWHGQKRTHANKFLRVSACIGSFHGEH